MIKGLHTVIWASIEACMVYVLIAGLIGRTDRRVGLAAGVVAAEMVVFAANGCRCPLSEVTESLGAERGTVTDLYLPAFVARNLPAIHVPIIVMAAYLHIRTLRRRRDPQPNAADCWRFSHGVFARFRTWLSGSDTLAAKGRPDGHPVSILASGIAAIMAA